MGTLLPCPGSTRVLDGASGRIFFQIRHLGTQDGAPPVGVGGTARHGRVTAGITRSAGDGAVAWSRRSLIDRDRDGLITRGNARRGLLATRLALPFGWGWLIRVSHGADHRQQGRSVFGENCCQRV
jgi:hypothetical protein